MKPSEITILKRLIRGSAKIGDLLEVGVVGLNYIEL